MEAKSGRERVRESNGTGPQVAVAMLGARMHYAVPRLLHEAGLLARFFTDTYIGNKPRFESTLKKIPYVSSSSLVRGWLARSDPLLPNEKVTSFDILGIRYAWARARLDDEAERSRVYRSYASRFNRAVLSSGWEDASAVWGFNSASVEMFRAAKNRGMCCILEQCILPERLRERLIREEQERWGGSGAGLSGGRTDEGLDARESEEWGLADCIVAGSRFVYDGLVELGVAASKIAVVPYGVDTQRFICCRTNAEELARPEHRPLRVLFAGEVGLRKGVPYLFAALRYFSATEVEARVVGGINLANGLLKGLPTNVRVMGRVARANMLEQFRWADVFVLPSIVEGSATVIYEALASGVPVITTENAGSIVRDGVDGFVVPIRDVDALVASIRRYQRDRRLLAEHQHSVANDSARVGLDRYRDDLVAVVKQVVGRYCGKSALMGNAV